MDYIPKSQWAYSSTASIQLHFVRMWWITCRRTTRTAWSPCPRYTRNLPLGKIMWADIHSLQLVVQTFLDLLTKIVLQRLLATIKYYDPIKCGFWKKNEARKAPTGRKANMASTEAPDMETEHLTAEETRQLAALLSKSKGRNHWCQCQDQSSCYARDRHIWSLYHRTLRQQLHTADGD